MSVVPVENCELRKEHGHTVNTTIIIIKGSESRNLVPRCVVCKSPSSFVGAEGIYLPYIVCHTSIVPCGTVVGSNLTC